MYLMANPSQPIKIRKRRAGRVVSTKTSNTAVVEVAIVKASPKYEKRFTRDRRYQAENPGNKFGVGDQVIIEECRPLSRLKRWRIIKLGQNL